VVAMLNNVLGTIVAFIPEGMPIGVALTLMMVARQMKAASILPKGLSTVETLGCINVLCSDKTGTLTENKMIVSSTGFIGSEYSVEWSLQIMGSADPPQTFKEFHKAMLLCNDSVFDNCTKNLPIAKREIHGNATDAAIFRFAHTAMPGNLLQESNPRLFQIPFNSTNKWMLTLFSNGADSGDTQDPEYIVYVKGAPDVLLPKCATYYCAKTDTVLPLDTDARAMFSALQDRLSRQAERVIILCKRNYTPTQVLGSNIFGDEIVRDCVQNLTIIGVLGIMDPPRAETAHTVESCRRAGIRFLMVTGDFGLTAVAIARQIGILTGEKDPHRYRDIVKTRDEKIAQDLMHLPDETKKSFWKKKSSSRGNLPLENFQGSLVLDGPDLGQLTSQDWDVVCGYREIVFARTTPEQKLRIVNEFKERDNVVAVTGDGVNDAPALRAAHVGVAVVSGSDVAIEAADLVLLDKFDSIVDAIRLGRLVFQNLQKMISYLLPAGSWSEVWPVLMNVFVGIPLPLSSFLMIIICVFTDVFSSMALIMEQEEFDLLSLPPRNHKRDHLINFKIYAQSYLFIGVMETIAAHSMFFLYMYQKAGIPMRDLILLYEGYTEGFYGYTNDELLHFNAVGQSIYFVTLVILQWGNLLSIRNKRLSITQADPIRKAHRNLWIPCGALVSFGIAVLVTETPGIQEVFGTAAVPIKHWLIPIALGVGILSIDEIRKLLVRMFPTGPVARFAW
jgi:sodium/potassium-transporting ATPase subunit alpha